MPKTHTFLPRPRRLQARTASGSPPDHGTQFAVVKRRTRNVITPAKIKKLKKAVLALQRAFGLMRRRAKR